MAEKVHGHYCWKPHGMCLGDGAGKEGHVRQLLCFSLAGISEPAEPLTWCGHCAHTALREPLLLPLLCQAGRSSLFLTHTLDFLLMTFAGFLGFTGRVDTHAPGMGRVVGSPQGGKSATLDLSSEGEGGTWVPSQAT